MSFSFSQVNAIGRKMKEMMLDRDEESSGFRGLFSSHKSKQAYEPLKIRAADIDFLRAEVFLEDIYELGQVEISMDQLIALLYEDFIYKVRQTKDLRSIYLNVKKLKDELSFTNMFSQLVDVSDDHLVLHKRNTFNQPKLYMLEVRMHRRSALRGEVFLMDIRQFDPSLHLKLEELVSLLFLNMVERIRTGDQTKLVREILQHFSSR
ncbi:hypothetical protein LJR153_007135 [Paenibacillus sp. LjRoot153]|uniref:hypothetical protein n=1 Tax=Paenibacillus sp. LjRoot153 TaxID=3342270 RepID=UPI003ECFF033